MPSSNSIKFLFAFALCSFGACGWRAAKSGEAPAAAAASPFAAERATSGAPFSTAEPENFQADFVVALDNEPDAKIFVARAAGRRRYDYNLDRKNQFTVLQTNADASFLIFPNGKIYAETSASPANAAPETAATAENFKDFLTNERLNQKPDATFTRLGAENNLTKYAVRFNDSDASEIVVFVDEAINLPVRQEFYSAGGERKTLTYAVEMKNFKRQADENLFEIPKDYRKVSLAELKAAMRNENFDE